MTTYRKRPLTVEAFKLPFDARLISSSYPVWWMDACASGKAYYQGGGEGAWYYTIEHGGNRRSRAFGGWWVLRFPDGALGVMAPEDFAANYEEEGGA